MDLDGDICATVEVDVEYPEDLHDVHQLPFLPVHGVVTSDMLSPTSRCEQPSELTTLRSSNGEKRLLATLLPRSKMIIDARALRSALDNGLVLKKVHRVLYSQQRAWVAEYINQNSEKRKEAMLVQNKPLKELYKLMNNSVSGKLMENKEGRVKVELVRDGVRHEHLISQSTYIDSTETADGVFIVRMHQDKVKRDSAYATAASMLDLAKMHAYQMIYDFQKAFLTIGGCDIIYHDTDSAVFKITMDDREQHPDEIFALMADSFDFSNMPKLSELFDDSRCGDVGRWKDETAGFNITEWISPQPRSYQGPSPL